MKVINNNTIITNQIFIETLNFSDSKSIDDWIAKLARLNEQIGPTGNQIPKDSDAAQEAQESVSKAIAQAKSPIPNGGNITQHLKNAKEWVSATGMLATELTSAIAAAGELF